VAVERRPVDARRHRDRRDDRGIGAGKIVT
jgi:hypothetical protein